MGFIKYLPSQLRDKPNAIALYQGLEEWHNQLAIMIEYEIDNRLNSAIANDDGLNFIAGLLGLNRWFWLDEWSILEKRSVIINYKRIILERGNENLIPYLFSLFNLDVSIAPSSGWILGVSVFPIALEGNVYTLEVRIPQIYSASTQRKTIDLILKEFKPDFITWDVIEVI